MCIGLVGLKGDKQSSHFVFQHNYSSVHFGILTAVFFVLEVEDPSEL